MYVQRLQAGTEYAPGGEPILDTFAEVQQVWHPWRRRYDLFIRCFRPPMHHFQITYLEQAG